MRIERRYTKAGQSPYADIAFRLTTSEIRNPDGSIVFHADNVEVPEQWSQVASDVLAQKYFRKAGVPARLKKVEEETVPSWLWRSVADETALAELPESERYRRRTLLQAGVRPARRHLDLLGLEGRLLFFGSRRASLLRRAPLHAGHADGGAELAAMVQHRPALGLWHRRPEPGTLLRRLSRPASSCNRPAPTSIRSRTPASSSRSPTTSSTRAGSWICGCARRACSSTAPAPARISRAARRRRKALRRRQVVRPDELPQDRRPRRGRDQVRRHHAPRRQDGDRRCRSSRHRAVHQLEGDRGAEGRRASSPAPRSIRGTCARSSKRA